MGVVLLLAVSFASCAKALGALTHAHAITNESTRRDALFLASRGVRDGIVLLFSCDLFFFGGKKRVLLLEKRNEEKDFRNKNSSTSTIKGK